MTDRITRLSHFASYENCDDSIVEAARNFIDVNGGITPNLMFANQYTWDKVSENEFLEGTEKCDFDDDETAEYEKAMAKLPYKFPRFKNFPELSMYGYVACHFAVSYFIDEKVENDFFVLALDEVIEDRIVSAFIL